MRDLRLTDKNKALGIRLYGKCCKTQFNTDNRNDWGPIIRNGVEIKCDHPTERIVYKVLYVVPKTRNERKCKQLETRSTTEANELALKFKAKLIETNWGRDYKKKTKDVSSNFLLDVMALYIDYLNNVNVPFQKRKIRDKEHIKDVERTFRYFLNYIVEVKNRKAQHFQITSINDELVGEFMQYLRLEKEYGWKYISKHISSLNSLFKYLIDKKNYPIENYFDGIVINKPKGKKKPESITKEKFEEVLKIIDTGETHLTLSKGEKKLMYYDWLKTAFKLEVYLGCRRKGTTLVKWSDIVLYDGELLAGYIDMCDYKDSSKKEMETGDSEEYYQIPIYHELKELLLELGYNEKYGTDEYILAPDSELKRKTMENMMSRGFSHYYKQLGYDKNLQMGCLRKKYVSEMKRHFGINHTLFTGHSTGSVVDEYYFDSKVLVAEVKKFRLFR